MTSYFDLHDTTALIIGGGTGLGKEAARAFLRHGAKVIIASRQLSSLEKTADELARETSGDCRGLAVDVTSDDSVSQLAVAVKSAFNGRLNILVYAAGINIRGPIQEVTTANFLKVQDTNLTGALRVAREFRDLLHNGSFGRLINVTSIFSSVSFAGRSSYASSKGGLIQLTRTLAVEWAGSTVTVNCISPGPFLTDINLEVLKNPDAYQRFCERIPFKRFGKPEELGTTFLFLASPASSYVNGADIVVDGGWTAS